MAAGHLMTESTCQYCGSGISLMLNHPIDLGPVWVHKVSGGTQCSLFASPVLPPPLPVTVAAGDWVNPWTMENHRGSKRPPPDRSWLRTTPGFRWFRRRRGER